jgi:hypothetical protein
MSHGDDWGWIMGGKEDFLPTSTYGSREWLRDQLPRYKKIREQLLKEVEKLGLIKESKKLGLIEESKSIVSVSWKRWELRIWGQEGGPCWDRVFGGKDFLCFANR